MSPLDRSRSVVHRAAVVATIVALCSTMLMGALVTTHGAGMAFKDWPSSDGLPIWLYPWLKDLGKNLHKFLEHGHRLAGALIGFVALSLAAITWRCESRGWVRWLALAILLGVIGQGVLGGLRVIQDARSMAVVHGCFAAVLFCGMGLLAEVTTRGWRDAEVELQAALSAPGESTLPARVRQARFAGCVAIAVVAGQYFVGALLRHLGWYLPHHLGLSFLAFAAVGFAGFCAVQTGLPSLVKRGGWALLLVLLQMGLGLGAFLTKYGMGDAVAVHGSVWQVGFRTAHVLGGMLLVMTLAILTLRAARLASMARETCPATTPALPLGSLSTGGLR